MASYATPADMLARFDTRDVGDLVSDDGEQVGAVALVTDARLLAALADASGQVESALVVGDRYTTSDLEGLTGNSLGLLKRIVCNLAMAFLMDRRPNATPEQLEARLKSANEYLDRLRKGENVFNLEDQREAGNPSIGGPTIVEYNSLNLWSQRPRGKFFPTLSLPLDR